MNGDQKKRKEINKGRMEMEFSGVGGNKVCEIKILFGN